MVASGRQRTRSTAENGIAVVFHLAYLAVHHPAGPDHFSAKGSPNRLVSQADSQHRPFTGKIPEQIDADPRLLGSAWTGRNHDVRRPQALNFFATDLIVAPHFNLFSHFTQILDQVVSERIVVVEDENHASSYSYANASIGSFCAAL